jgi:hypothetical protein
MSGTRTARWRVFRGRATRGCWSMTRRVRLVRIRRDYGGGNVQLAYDYGYGFDGGRRWRKDYLNGVWTRYPCGVACGAGDLVEQTSDLSGSQWTTSALYLQGISLVRRNSEWHHFDPLGTAQVITNGSAQVVSNNVYDTFGVLRYQQGSAQTPWRWRERAIAEEGTILATSTRVQFVPARMQATCAMPLSVRIPGIDTSVRITPLFTKQECRDACGCLFPEHGPKYKLCMWVCKTLRGNSCNALWAYCQHLLRHGQKSAAEVCKTLYLQLCWGE